MQQEEQTQALADADEQFMANPAPPIPTHYTLERLFPFNHETLQPPKDNPDPVARTWQLLWSNFLRENKPQHSSGKQPSIFISYAWATHHYHPQFDFPTYKHYEHVVEKIANDCKQAGFNVLLDRWVDKGNKGIDAFLETLEHIDICLVIGTPLYLYKYENRRPEGDHIIRAEVRLLNFMSTFSQDHAEKIYPLILEGNQKTSIPFLLRKSASGYWLNQDGIQNYFEMMLKVFKDAWNINYDTFKPLKNHFYDSLKAVKITQADCQKFNEALAAKTAREAEAIAAKAAAAKDRALQLSPPAPGTLAAKAPRETYSSRTDAQAQIRQVNSACATLQDKPQEPTAHRLADSIQPILKRPPHSRKDKNKRPKKRLGSNKATELPASSEVDEMQTGASPHQSNF